MGIKLEDGIPLAPIQHHSTNNRKGTVAWAVRNCEVGQSFFIPNKLPNQLNILHYYKDSPEKKFKKRRVQEKGKEGTRIWRVV